MAEDFHPRVSNDGIDNKQLGHTAYPEDCVLIQLSFSKGILVIFADVILAVERIIGCC